MILRWYQKEAIKKLIDYLDGDNLGHPIIVMPTGSGKTAVLCEFINTYLSENINSNILVLSHIREILEQDYKVLSNYFEGFSVGLYSAGLKRRIIKKITVAGIQSAYRSPEYFKDFDIILIDECHLVTMKQSGMYRKFFKSINATYIGLTATHFRLGHGYIHQGEGALFTDIVYDLSSRDNFNRLVDEGYLTKLITKTTIMDMDTSRIKTKAGDFALDDLSKTFDRKSITNEAVDEIIKFGKNYKKWLIFAIDIDHAEHISTTLNSKGIPTICVHSKMDTDRADKILQFKSGQYRAIVNVNILTTGFDVPEIDLIAMLRPTKSPVIHVQTIGRGLRVAEGKDHCLVLDFAGNTERLGPINDVLIKTKNKTDKTGEPITKTCPDCGVIHHPTTKICDVCGHVFVFKEKLKTTAGTTEIVRRNIVDWADVDGVSYHIHTKANKPNMLLVKYRCGLITFNEYICFDHRGYAKYKADAWVRFRTDYWPQNTDDLFQNSNKLKMPSRIKIDVSNRMPKIVDSQFPLVI